MSPLTAEKVAARERERIAVIRYLCDTAMAEPVAQWPFWRLWLYALLRPVKMAEIGGRMMALANAAQAIDREYHLPRIIYGPLDSEKGE